MKLSTTTYLYALLALLLPLLVLAFTEPVVGWVRAAALLLPAAAYAYLLTLSQKTGRAVWWMFPLIFLSAFQIVISYLYERGVIAVDMFLNLLTTNGGEAAEVLAQIGPSVVIVVVVYVPLLVLATCEARRKGALSPALRRTTRRGALLTAVAGLACAALSFATPRPLRPLVDVFPLNVVYNLSLAVERTYAQTQYARRTEAFRFQARSMRPARREVYVLVVGETARYDAMAPLDVARRPDVVSYERAFTQSNTTHKSVPMLLTALSATTFDSLSYHRGLLTAAREAGFQTAFVSNQKRNHSYIDLLAQAADTTIYINDYHRGERYLLDGDMLPYVERELSAARGKQFIVLHAYGQHFEYSERYPHHAAPTAKDPQTLRHEYHEASRYMDHVLARLIRLLEVQRCPAAMLYTSDHGENLWDDSRHKFLHASPIPSYYELHIPLMIWTSADYRRQHPDLTARLRRHRATPLTNSQTVFHTMLALAGIATLYLSDTLSLTSTAYRAPRPFLYLNDHNEAVPLPDMHLDAVDYQMIDKALGE